VPSSSSRPEDGSPAIPGQREPQPAAAVPPLYRNRDYALLWVGQTLSLVGSQSSWVAYPLLVLSLTGSAAKAGVVGFASWIPYVLFQLPAGALVDRWDRKRTMLVCDALRALAVASIAVALPLGWLSFWQLVAVAFVERTLSIFFEPAETVALSRVVAPERISEAVARNNAREYTASLIGPPLGGVLYGISRLAPFAADAASYVVSFFSVAALRTPLASEPVVDRQPLRAEVKEGVQFIWRIPFLRDSALQAAGTNVTWASLALALIVVARRHGASGVEIGAMFALMGVGGILGSAASGPLLRRLSARILVLGSVWWWAALVALLVTTANPFLLGAGAGAALFLAPAWNGAVAGLRIRLTPNRLQGRVHAVDALLSFGARPFGLLLTGYLLDRIGGHETIAVIAGWTLLIAIGSMLSPALRHPPATEAGWED
jgi:predicted MFS family arabinose efflux permease